MKKILNNKIISIIFATLEWLVFFVLLVLIVLTGFQKFSNQGNFFGYRIYTVASGSMIPIYNIWGDCFGQYPLFCGTGLRHLRHHLLFHHASVQEEMADASYQRRRQPVFYSEPAAVRHFLRRYDGQCHRHDR